MTHADEEEIAQVGGEKDVVRRILLVVFLEWGTWFVSCSVSIAFICTKTKLQMVEGNALF